MERFYTSGRTADIGASLESAKRAQSEYSHPLYWRAFFIVGDAPKSALATARK
jgi:CHAT domain-containing protein